MMIVTIDNTIMTMSVNCLNMRNDFLIITNRIFLKFLWISKRTRIVNTSVAKNHSIQSHNDFMFIVTRRLKYWWKEWHMQHNG